MVNSDDPSNDYASLQSYYNYRTASREPQPPSEQPVPARFSNSGEIFQQPLLRRVDTPPGSLEPKLPAGAKISGIRFLTHLHAQTHVPPLYHTRQRVRAHDSFSGSRTSSPESPAADLLAYLPGSMIQHLHLHFFLCFVSSNCTFLGFLDFSNTQRHLQDFESCFSYDLLLFGFYGYQRFNLFSHFGCICYYYIREISYIPRLHSNIQICIHCVCCPDR